MSAAIRRLWFLSLVGILVIVLGTGCQPKKAASINVGAVLSLTGSAAQYGQWTRNGMEIALDEVNQAGGIGGSKLAVTYEDDASQPTTAVSAFKKLVTVDHVPAVIGPLTSSNALACAPVAESEKVVLLSPCASSPKLTTAGDYVFRNWPSDNFEGRAMADYLKTSLKAKTVAVLAMNNEYGIGVRDVFVARAKEIGMTIVANDSFAQDATDFRSQLSKIAPLKPDVLYAPGHAKEVARLFKQAREIGIASSFASSVAFGSDEVFAIAGKAAEGVCFTAPSFDPASKDSAVQGFAGKYKARYGTEPEVFAAHAYDAVRILALALQKGGATSSGIRDALYQIKDFPGVTGSTTFDQNGDVVKPITVKQVKNGAFVVAGP